MKINQDNAMELFTKVKEKLEALAIPKEKLGLLIDEESGITTIVNIDDYNDLPNSPVDLGDTRDKKSLKEIGNLYGSNTFK
jgi:hypothetical protein